MLNLPEELLIYICIFLHSYTFIPMCIHTCTALHTFPTLSYTYTYPHMHSTHMHMHALHTPHAVPTLSLDTSSSITVTEGQSIDICATLSSIPTGGLECDIVLQLQTTPSPVDPGIIVSFVICIKNVYVIDCSVYTTPIHTFNLAMEGVDYTLEGDFQIVFNSAVIDNSTSTNCARINLTADSVLEKSEFFSLMVTSVTPSIVSGNVSESVRVQLDDNDGECIAYLSSKTSMR